MQYDPRALTVSLLIIFFNFFYCTGIQTKNWSTNYVHNVITITYPSEYNKYNIC